MRGDRLILGVGRRQISQRSADTKPSSMKVTRFRKEQSENELLGSQTQNLEWLFL